MPAAAAPGRRPVRRGSPDRASVSAGPGISGVFAATGTGTGFAAVRRPAAPGVTSPRMPSPRPSRSPSAGRVLPAGRLEADRPATAPACAGAPDRPAARRRADSLRRRRGHPLRPRPLRRARGLSSGRTPRPPWSPESRRPAAEAPQCHIEVPRATAMSHCGATLVRRTPGPGTCGTGGRAVPLMRLVPPRDSRRGPRQEAGDGREPVTQGAGDGTGARAAGKTRQPGPRGAAGPGTRQNPRAESDSAARARSGQPRPALATFGHGGGYWAGSAAELHVLQHAERVRDQDGGGVVGRDQVGRIPLASMPW